MINILRVLNSPKFNPRWGSQLIVLATLFICAMPSLGQAEVVNSSSDGFSITIERTTPLTAKRAFQVLVDDFSKWYDAEHSYSGAPDNLSLDLKRMCMYEKLADGGYVRHMEIKFYQPSKKTLVMTGGLGPLQGMGVSGALTFSCKQGADDKPCSLQLKYNVVGAQFQKLDQIAPVVNQVLTGQWERLKKHCDSLAN